MAQLTPEQKAQLTALVIANGLAYEKLEERLVDAVLKLLSQIRGLWFTRGVTEPVEREIADLVRDAQEAVGDLTEEFSNQVFEALRIRVPKRQADLHVKMPAKLRGLDILKEWERPARDARVIRLLGADEFEANEKARWRAEQQARMDLALARREAERQRWGLSEDITGYRRILHPELSQTGPCALCIVAATRIYGKADLKPLHGGCVCTTLPVTKSFDPGLELNRDDLDAIYEAAGGNRRENLIRVYGLDIAGLKPEAVEGEHGELGPYLYDPRFRNRDAKRTEELARKGMDPQRVYDVQRKLVEKFEKDIAAGKKVSAKTLEFHRRMRDEWLKKLNDAA
ncbi:hypothetical protein GCM10022234_00230 [Aeromicrobium panaciterrae]|uniref:hypothetical protein n=1 Tax=Aeromicrobium panaciterrae TaxID=363861 RepID=UPI0031D0D2EF